MLRKALFVIGILILAGGMLGAVMYKTSASANQGNEAGCPPGYSRVIALEPIQEGEQSSTSVDQGCEPITTVQGETLDPIRPGDEGWDVKPYVPTEKSEVVFGPSQETEYRCVSFLQPIQPGDQTSKESELVCSKGPIDSINGVSLDSSFLIAKFYDNTNYGTLLIEYYGPSACSDTISYGKTTLSSDLDNKFASGRSFSECNLIYVYDFSNYSGPSYSCGPNCPSFYALNNYVSSWRTIH